MVGAVGTLAAWGYRCWGYPTTTDATPVHEDLPLRERPGTDSGWLPRIPAFTGPAPAQRPPGREGRPVRGGAADTLRSLPGPRPLPQRHCQAGGLVAPCPDEQ